METLIKSKFGVAFGGKWQAERMDEEVDVKIYRFQGLASLIFYK